MFQYYVYKRYLKSVVNGQGSLKKIKFILEYPDIHENTKLYIKTIKLSIIREIVEQNVNYQNPTDLVYTYFGVNQTDNLLEVYELYENLKNKRSIRCPVTTTSIPNGLNNLTFLNCKDCVELINIPYAHSLHILKCDGCINLETISEKLCFIEYISCTNCPKLTFPNGNYTWNRWVRMDF